MPESLAGKHRMLGFLLREIGTRPAAVLFLIVCLITLLDFAGVAIIFPFLKLLTDPVLAEALLQRAGLERSVPAPGATAFVLASGAALLLFYSLKTLAQTRLMAAQVRILSRCTARITDDLVSRILRTRYSTFQDRAASEIAGTISVTPHASAALAAIMQAANDALLLLLMFAGFALVKPVFAASALVLGIMAGALVYWTVVRMSVRTARELREFDIERYRLLYSISSAIRDIKIMGLEGLFEQSSAVVSKRHAELHGRLTFLNLMPRMLVEFLALAAIVVLACAIVMLRMPVSEAGPLLGVIVIGTMRAIPSFSRLMGSLNVFGGSAQYVRMLMDLRESLSSGVVRRLDDTLEFADAIELHDVGFRYGDRMILDRISLRLGRRESIGIVGLSGAGKSTLLDVLTGLQPVSSGTFTCDGKPFDPFLSSALQRLIGYVPQAITLLDESIAFNVSFEKSPDEQAVRRALASANLEAFVDALPAGTATRVGENGLRLSGGQRQRLGIARALYRNPAILVFDEATSSLDSATEALLVAEVERLRANMSVVVVAHRLSTVRSCDRIYVIAGGRIVASGTHAELMASSADYRALATGQVDQAEPGG